MSVGLFCSTAPIIEETNAKIYPLTINYPHMEGINYIKTARFIIFI